MSADSISFRPLSLGPTMTSLGGPAGRNPFASFAKGAGASLNPAGAAAAAGTSSSSSASTSAPREERKKKNPADIISYDTEFLMGFAKSCMTPAPAALEAFPELVIDSNDGDADAGEGAAGAARGAVARAAAEAGVSVASPAAAAAPEERDWRSRGAAGDASPGGGKQQQQQQQARNRAQAQEASGDAGEAPAIVRAADVGRTAWAPSSDRTSSAPAAAPSAPSSSSSSAAATAVSLKAVKGILNKLTPEKFDRLAAQLVDHASVSADVLRGAIALVFEAAVAQPTFVATYADLCNYLASRVPEFPADASNSDAKPMGFKRVLLNTCQEEFEGAAAARAELRRASGGTAAGADEDAGGDAADARAARAVKQRTLGTVRLISQLYLKGVVTDKIVHVCVQDLLGEFGSVHGGGGGGKGSSAASSSVEEPSHDAIEAVCEVFQVAGKKLDSPPAAKEGGEAPNAAAQAQNARVHAARLEGYMLALNRLSKSKTLPSRLRFMVRDVLDLRQARWIPRREGLAAKKLAEVRAEAAAELGLVPAALLLPALAADLPALPSGSLAGGGGGVGGGQGSSAGGASGGAGGGGDDELFPAFRSDAGIAAGGAFSSEKVGDVAVASAFLGEYTTPAVASSSSSSEAAAAAAPAAGAAAAPSTTGRSSAAASAAAAPAADKKQKKLTEDEAESLAASLFTDYLATKDAAEAAAAARELLAAESSEKSGGGSALSAERLARIGLDRMVDSPSDAEGESLAACLVSLGKQGGAVGPEALKAALAEACSGLDDLALDVPKAAGRLGALVGSLLASGLLSASAVPEFLADVESAAPKRDLLLRAARVVRTEKGDAGLEKLKSDGFKAVEVAKAADFEEGEMPSAEAFLKESGLGALI